MTRRADRGIEIEQITAEWQAVAVRKKMNPRGNQKDHFEQFWARLTKWAPEGLRRFILNSFGRGSPNGLQRASEGSF